MKQRTDITLTGDDVEWFEEIREEIAAERNGNKPTKAETMRLLMQEVDMGA